MLLSYELANVKTIKFYRGNTAIQAIECLKQDGSCISTGYIKNDRYPVTFNFTTDEKLTMVRLYSSKHRFVGIHLKTDKQRDLQCYAQDYRPVPGDDVDIPVGSGFWQGIFGHSGAEIDCFGLAIHRFHCHL